MLGLAAWNNVVVTRLPGYPTSYVAANVAATGVVLAAARAAGLSWEELGLARRRLAAGARWGGTCFVLAAAAYVVALADNARTEGSLRTAGAVLLGCIATAVAGAALAYLRLRTRSLLAPALLHLATNSLGTLAAAAALRL